MLAAILWWMLGSADSASASPDRWSGDIAFGLLATTGNTHTLSANGKLRADYANDPWRNFLTVTGLSVSESEVQTTERYTLTDQVSRSLTERDYVYGVGDFELDQFGALSRRFSGTLGYGRRFSTDPEFQFDGELGAGGRWFEVQDSGETSRELVLRARALYLWKYSETGSFGQSLIVESGASNTIAEWLTELRLTVVGDISLVASFTLRHNTDVPPGTTETDTFTAINIAYRFGDSEVRAPILGPSRNWRNISH